MKDKGFKIRGVLKQHIENNSKEYIIVTLLFVIGIFLGVFFVNNIQETPRLEIQNYINNFIEKMKIPDNVDNTTLLRNSVGQNILIAVIICFFGTTVIRNTSCVWDCSLSRILFRIYSVRLYFCYGNR